MLPLLFFTGGINRAGKIPCRLTMLRVWGKFITACPLERHLSITGWSLPQKSPSKHCIMCSSNFTTNNYQQSEDFIIYYPSQAPPNLRFFEVSCWKWYMSSGLVSNHSMSMVTWRFLWCKHSSIWSYNDPDPSECALPFLEVDGMT